MKYVLDDAIIAEVEYLAEFFQVDSNILYYLARYAISQQNSDGISYNVPTDRKRLPLQSLKEAIFLYFNVKNTPELKRSKSFQKAIGHLPSLNLKHRRDWEKLYREFIGDLPVNESAIDNCSTLPTLDKFCQDSLEKKTVLVHDLNIALQRASQASLN